jgi:hypothetical protein
MFASACVLCRGRAQNPWWWRLLFALWGGVLGTAFPLALIFTLPHGRAGIAILVVLALSSFGAMWLVERRFVPLVPK